MAEDVFGIVGSLQAGAFRVTRAVAEGGFAVVYRAHHEGSRADVALKCLKLPGALSAEQRQAFLLGFREEGELIFRLSALIPEVVRPLHVGSIEQASQGAFVPFIALEWLEGESLEAHVRRRAREGMPPLELARVARLLGPAARAVERAHRFPAPEGVASVLHSDLKPENLFIATAHGQDAVKVLDFGIAKVKGAVTQIVGRASLESELAAFTPAYAAPEQWLPRRYGQTGTWTDVWGFALTMVEVLAGRPPLEGDLEAVMGACLDERRRPTPRALGVELPSSVEAAFEKALAIEPRDRYQDLGAFWDVIEAATGVRTPRIVAEPARAIESAVPSASALATAIPDLEVVNIRAKGASSRAKLPSEELDLAPRPKARPAPRSSHDFHLLGNDAGAQGAEPEPGPPSSGASFELATDSRVPPRTLGRVAANVREPSSRGGASALLARSLPALQWLGLAALIMIADLAYVSQSGAPFELGPLRAVFVAAPLGVWGLFKLASALLGD